jgi:hypothetical protein
VPPMMPASSSSFAPPPPPPTTQPAAAVPTNTFGQPFTAPSYPSSSTFGPVNVGHGNFAHVANSREAAKAKKAASTAGFNVFDPTQAVSRSIKFGVAHD